MGKEAVRNQLHVFLEDVTEYAVEEMKPLNVVGFGFLPGNSLFKFLLSPMIRKELDGIKISLQNEFNLIVDYAEEIAEGEDPDPEKYRDRFLASDFFFQHYEGDRTEEFEEVMMQRLDEVGRDMAPIIEADEDDFWDSLKEAYDKHEAQEVLNYHFSFTEKQIVDGFADGLRLTFTLLGPIRFNYTKEAMRVLPKAEGFLRDQMADTLDEVYGEGSVVDELQEENERLKQRVEELEEENERLREEGTEEETETKPKDEGDADAGEQEVSGEAED